MEWSWWQDLRAGLSCLFTFCLSLFSLSLLSSFGLVLWFWGFLTDRDVNRSLSLCLPFMLTFSNNHYKKTGTSYWDEAMWSGCYSSWTGPACYCRVSAVIATQLHGLQLSRLIIAVIACGWTGWISLSLSQLSVACWIEHIDCHSPGWTFISQFYYYYYY